MFDSAADDYAEGPAGYRPVGWVRPRPTVEVRDGAIYLGSDIPLRNEDRNLIEMLLRAAQRWPDRSFMVERDPASGWIDLSFAAFVDRVSMAAAGMTSVAPGAAVALLAVNSLDAAIATFAIMARGAVVVPLSTAYLGKPGGDAALGALARSAGVVLAYADDVQAAAVLGCPVRPLGEVSAPRDDRFDLEAAAQVLAPDQVAKILFTSGSTGFPKAVPNTHGMLTASAAMIRQTLHRLPDDAQHVQVDWLPWHHTFGGNVNLHGAISSGGRFVIDGGSPTPEGFGLTLRNFAEIGPTGISTVPAAYPVVLQAMQADPRLARAILRNLHGASFGGAALPPPVAQAVQSFAEQVIGARIMFGSGYGMTETSGIIARVHWPTERTDLLGLPMPGVEIKLTPQGDGRFDCRVRGPNIFTGYGLDGDRGAFDEEGFFITGDAVTSADPDDWSQGLVYAGRIAEDFKLQNGVFVQAGRLRLALLDHLGPAVRDVLIVGEGRDGVGCLVWPMDYAVASADWLADRIAAFNVEARGASRSVWRAALFADPPHAKPEELTPKGGLNAPRMRDTRRSEIDRLFS